MPDTSLTLTEITVRFGGVRAVDAVTLSVQSSTVTGLIGPNGAGKTTLLDVVSGYVRPTRGTVHLGEHNLSRRSPSSRARFGVGRTFQTPRLFPGLTVLENLEIAYRQRHHRHGRPVLDPRDALRTTGMDGTAHVLVDALTVSQKRLCEMARSLTTGPHVLLLDEPATGLQEAEVAFVGALLADLSRELHLGILVVDHDMRLVLGTCDTVAVMDFGQLIAVGEPDTVRADPAVVDAYFGQEVLR